MTVEAGVTEHGRAGWRAADRAATIAWLAALAVAATLCVYLGVRSIAFPYPLDYGEGPLLDQATRLARFENIYGSDLSRPPWVVTNYPPLFALLQVPWIEWLGPAFWYGRLCSWLAILGAALCCGSVLHSLTASRLAAAAGSLTLLSIPFVATWAPLFRVDALALALSLGALACLARWPESRRAPIAAALLLTLSVYTRQSYLLAAPVAAFAYLAAASRRRALVFALVFAGLVSAVYLALDRTTAGGFSLHVITANVNEFSVPRLARLAREFVALLPVLVAASAAFATLGRRACPAAWRLIVPYGLAAALGALSIGKVGSNVNYWLECCAAASLATGALVHVLQRRPLVRAAAALLLLLQTSALLDGGRYGAHLRAKLEARAQLEAIDAVVRAEPGPVLADEALGLLPLAGRRVELQPFEMTRLALAGSWDEAPLLAALERQEYRVILMHRAHGSLVHLTRWTPRMLESIDRYYERAASLGPTAVFRPRARRPEPQ